MRMFYLYVNVCITRVPSVYIGQKRVSNPPLWMAVSHHVHAENRTQDLCKTNQYSKPLSHLPSPLALTLNTCAKVRNSVS